MPLVALHTLCVLNCFPSGSMREVFSSSFHKCGHWGTRWLFLVQTCAGDRWQDQDSNPGSPLCQPLHIELATGTAWHGVTTVVSFCSGPGEPGNAGEWRGAQLMQEERSSLGKEGHGRGSLHFQKAWHAFPFGSDFTSPRPHRHSRGRPQGRCLAFPNTTVHYRLLGP